MSSVNPTRLLDGDDAFSARLLRAGKAETAREGSDERVLLAVAATLAAEAPVLLRPSVGSWTWCMKGLVATMVMATLGATLVRWEGGTCGAPTGRGPRRLTGAVAPRGENLAQAAPEERSADVAADTPVEIVTPARTQPPAPRPRAQHPSAKPKPAASPPRTPAEELALVRRAKVALNAHDIPASVAALDEHARDFPRGAYVEEAAVIRIEGLLQAGDQESAHRKADEFLKAYPKSAYAQRIRGLLFGAPP